MRSQASKPLPKKGASSKTSLKISSATKQTTKKTPPKKVKNLVSKVKNTKKTNSKDDSSTGKYNEESTAGDKGETSNETIKAGTSKLNPTRSESPTKKSKRPKEKKDAIKTSLENVVKKIGSKKNIQLDKPVKSLKSGVKKGAKDKDNLKYKINVDAVKKTTSKFSKAKKIVKKGGNQNKKGENQPSSSNETPNKEQGEIGTKTDKVICNKNVENQEVLENKKGITSTNDKKDEANLQNKSETRNSTEDSNVCITPPKTSLSQPDTPRTETERPPKFFTSSRSPRMVDIDVKCCKNSKGNLSVSERFLSMKFETKADDGIKDNNPPNTLIAQGPEIDVYTFTEKVDSPKSILSDFRNPVNKNIGRVRPIARVKGTVIDKKSDSEKKKYSPHRPIEEVVKQLKANKRSEELTTTQTQSSCTASSVESTVVSDEKEIDEKPKPIVSKSYKMVARKSSITGKPFSPIKFLDQDPSPSKTEQSIKTTPPSKKTPARNKKQQKKTSMSEDDIDTSKFSINTKSLQYNSSDDSVNESNDDDDTKGSSESDTPKTKKLKNKKYKRITDSVKKTTSKELKELSKDSLVDLKDESALLGGDKPSKRRLKLLSMWSGPKKHRMASLNAIAKVHCLYENESRTHMELGLMKTIDRQVIPGPSKQSTSKKKEPKSKEAEKETTSESEYENQKQKKDESSDSSDDSPPQRSLRGVPGIRSAGKYWDPKSSTSSSEESEIETKKKTVSPEKKKVLPKSSSSSGKSDSDKPPAKMKKTAGVPVKKKRIRNEVVMDLKDMVVQKRMASLNATAILAASYEKRSPKSNKDETTSDSCSDESYSQKPKNGASSGVKSELKNEDTKKESDESSMTDRKQKVEVIVNQDTDVTITGMYSTHLHEGFCTVSGMQYRISSTSHTQTTATANCEKEGCPREDGARYTPLSALSSMQPPAEHAHTHPHPVPELGGLSRRPGCSSAFSAPSPAAHHEPGYYQPAGPLIKESSADAERALARYHPPPHYHAPHPPVLQQYGSAYYPDLCYGRYYRPPGPYHMPPPQPDAQMVGVGSEPYPPPQYYGTPPCYQHSTPQRIPYVEYRGCSCPLNACPKNVHIGPATGKAPAGGGPADVTSAHAPPGGSFRTKVRVCALETVADTHGSGKDPPLELEPPSAADAPHPCTIPTIGGASPKRELYDVRDMMRRTSDIPGPAEPLGPPSPARGSAGACAPQPPPIAPRRARLGKAMARRSLAGDDTGLLLCVSQPPLAHHSDGDDDVMAISPPLCAPIDLSSSDERSTPLVDVKKENEGPTYASSRKTDAQALREHNCTTLSETAVVADAAKAVKRRYSRPKLEIDMKDTQLEDGCKTNGIGEHVKLQKRRKVSSDQTDIPRTETVTVTKESKRKATQTKRSPKTPSTEKKCSKRKIEGASTGPRAKKILLETRSDEDIRLKNVALVVEESMTTKPKTKSALLLDKLIRKNSIDRADSKGYASDKDLNPAELFLTPNENVAQNGAKKTLNINNNVVDSTGSVNGVRPNTIAAVNQLIGKKMAYKNACKVENVDSKVTNSLKSVLKTPTAESGIKEDRKVTKCELSNKNSTNVSMEKSVMKTVEDITAKCETVNDKCETVKDKCDIIKDILCETKDKSVDYDNLNVKSTKLSKIKADDIVTQSSEESGKESQKINVELDRTAEPDPVKIDRSSVKRCKLVNGEVKGKHVEKVVKLLVSKRPAIKMDEATLVVEEACASPTPGSGSLRRARRRIGGVGRRARRLIPPPSPPALDSKSAPRWSNGWNWDGEHYLSKVYLNNDSRLDRTARCWSRMTHASGDRVARGDCVLLRASLARAQPFVARVASLWENPEDGEMMVSLVWYYRPEHTERGRQPTDAPDEVFASRHRDANSVACIEDKCYVLTFNEYCRYRKRLKAAEEGITITPSIVPPLPASEINPAFAPNDSKLPPSVSPELVLFCRKIYDFRSKKIHVPNK